MQRAKQGSSRYSCLCRVGFNDRMVAYTKGNDKETKHKN